jgi:hypothetical protein
MIWRVGRIRQRAEVVIEGSILLYQHDDMTDLRESLRIGKGRDGAASAVATGAEQIEEAESAATASGDQDCENEKTRCREVPEGRLFQSTHLLGSERMAMLGGETIKLAQNSKIHH